MENLDPQLNLDNTLVNLSIVKVGTYVLIQDGKINNEPFYHIGKDVARIQKPHHAVAIVTSAAERGGMNRVNHSAEAQSIIPDIRCEYAAMGQLWLANNWQRYLGEQHPVIMNLVSLSDFLNPTQTLHMARTLKNTHLKYGAVVVANGDDFRADEEIREGDNDGTARAMGIGYLATGVFNNIDATFLTTANGVQEIPGNTRRAINSRIPFIKGLAELDSVIDMVGNVPEQNNGGMLGKLEKTRKLIEAGIKVHIGPGNMPEPITGTWRRQYGTTIEP